MSDTKRVGFGNMLALLRAGKKTSRNSLGGAYLTMEENVIYAHSDAGAAEWVPAREDSQAIDWYLVE